MLDELRRRQARRDELTTTLTAHEAVDVTPLDDRPALERRVRRCLEGWQQRLSGTAVDDARRALRDILVGPLTVTPTETPEGRTYRFEGRVARTRARRGGTCNLWYAPGWTRTSGPRLRRPAV